MKNVFYFFFIVFGFQVMEAQQNEIKLLNGKVILEYGNISDIYIINKRTENIEISDKNGFFSINVSVGDTLMVSSVKFKAKKIVVGEKDFEKPLFFVKMNPIMNQLQEVMVFQYKHINAVSMGLIPKGQKTFTPAERKLNTASNPYITGNVDGTSGGTIVLDPLFNALSGKTAMLKKIVEVEKKEYSIAKTENLFDDSFLANKLHIPKEYIKGFHFLL